MSQDRRALQLDTFGRAEACVSPRAAFKTGCQLGGISDQQDWLDMIADRNLTAHTYSAPAADEVFSRLKQYLGRFQALHQALSRRLSQP